MNLKLTGFNGKLEVLGIVARKAQKREKSPLIGANDTSRDRIAFYHSVNMLNAYKRVYEIRKVIKIET